MAMKDIRTFPNAQVLFKFCSNVSIWSDLSFVQAASLIENMSKKKNREGESDNGNNFLHGDNNFNI
jgi:hypothetical protein